jgi:hypothetical protein
MKVSKTAIKWLATGALFGYFIFHPIIHIISVFHFFSESPVPENLASEILKSFSVAMLPWGVAFMILNALIGLFWGKIKQADQEKSEIIAQLQKALEEVKTLSGFLPICASCEAYISEHSEAEFSHGICPECLEKLYPEI